MIKKNKKAILSGYGSYFKSTKWDRISCESLLKGIFDIPYNVWGTMQRGNILGFVRYFIKNDTKDVRLASLVLLARWKREGWKPARDFSEYMKNVLEATVRETEGKKGASAVRRLAFEIARGLTEIFPEYSEKAASPGGPFDDAVLFRENLDSNVSDLVKYINLRILREKYEEAEGNDPGFSGYYAHLLIFMRLNSEVVLFRRAGENLLAFLDRLAEHQKQEIMAELLNCVGQEEDSSHYLPYLISRCWHQLPPAMQRELVPELQRICTSDNPQAVEVIMGIASEILRHYSCEHDDREGSCPTDAFSEEDGYAKWIRRTMSGMLCQGVYSDRRIVAESAVYTIGNDLFRLLDGNTTGTDGRRIPDGAREPLVSVARSVLLYLKKANDPDPVYRYLTVHEIARYLTQIGESYEDPRRPVAFFAGSFDPFSNGHRAVAAEIAQMGFQVYISVDDFSWNRNTQPLDIRRKIVMLSIGDLAHVRIFPRELVINPDNPRDLARLCDLFPGQKVYLVCGSDRIEQDPLYQKAPTKGSVHSFPHIVFTRNMSDTDRPSGIERTGAGASGYAEEESANLTGEVIKLKLPIYYEHMTSLQIRYNLHEGRGIDDLVTVPARQYIRRRNLYVDERIYKKEIIPRFIETRVAEEGGRITVALADGQSGKILACLEAGRCSEDEGGKSFREVELLSLTAPGEEGCDRTRQKGSLPTSLAKAECTLLDEALLAFQARGIEMVYAPDSLCGKDIRKLLKERGFIRVSGKTGRYSVDLKSPLVLFGDAYSCVLEPFAGDPALVRVFEENERRLRLGMAGLYPGSAVLFLDGEILTGRISRHIRRRIGESSLQDDHKWICVPFGKILKYMQFPGVVTMALNTEKVYTPDLGHFEIRETAGYPRLPVQIGNLRSMDRPFILVDDFYHNGYRMQKITQSLRGQGLREEGLIAGAVSGRGREMARREGLSVEAVYEIPNMKLWILESDMIPFYGGDRVEQMREDPDREDGFVAGRRPSIYPMLPYQMPSFLKDAPYQAVYDLSVICLENARRLFTVLEKIYENRFFRRLTLERLTEVIDDPGFPEAALESPLSQGQTASGLLEQEITRLKRFKV